MQSGTSEKKDYLEKSKKSRWLISLSPTIEIFEIFFPSGALIFIYLAVNPTKIL